MEEVKEKVYKARGKPRAYTPDQLDNAVERYFRKISRRVRVTEMKPTGETDKYGHPVMSAVEVQNQDGEYLERIEYLVTPCVSSLCEFLGIHRSTWNDYCNKPEYADTTTRARGRFQNWLEQENLERDDKHLKGIQFDLMNNYGFRENVNVSSDSLEDFLAKAAEEGQARGF